MYDFHPSLEKAMQCAERALVQDSAVAIVQVELDPPEFHWRSQGWVPFGIEELIQKGADLTFRSANWDATFAQANAQPVEASP